MAGIVVLLHLTAVLVIPFVPHWPGQHDDAASLKSLSSSNFVIDLSLLHTRSTCSPHTFFFPVLVVVPSFLLSVFREEVLCF